MRSDRHTCLLTWIDGEMHILVVLVLFRRVIARRSIPRRPIHWYIHGISKWRRPQTEIIVYFVSNLYSFLQDLLQDLLNRGLSCWVKINRSVSQARHIHSAMHATPLLTVRGPTFSQDCVVCGHFPPAGCGTAAATTTVRTVECGDPWLTSSGVLACILSVMCWSRL